MCLLRANYDAYIRRRLINETALELESNKILADAKNLGSEKATTRAAAVLNQVVTHPVSADLRTRIEQLCQQLYTSIGLQTSVPKYHAIGAERGAILDFVDYPLNNRWWLEDEFKKVNQLPSEEEKVTRLNALAKWEHPGPGSFYDNVGNESKSPRVSRERGAEPMFSWWDEGKSRARLTWQATMWPRAMTYEGLDPHATYIARTCGLGTPVLRIEGDLIQPTKTGKEMGEFNEYRIPARYIRDQKLVLTWERPKGEETLNWRKRARLSEVWLLKN
jgi:hypothetical protein